MGGIQEEKWPDGTTQCHFTVTFVGLNIIMVINIFLTLFLVLLNGFFVAAEFAIVKVRMSQLQVRAGRSLTARIAESVVSNLDGYLAATQLGITLASLGLGWIGEEVVTEIILALMHLLHLPISEATAHQIALPVAFAFITVLHIVFGELAPKSLAIRHATPTTLAVAAPLKAFYVVFRPAIAVLNGFANFILRLIGIQPVPHSEIHSEEELKLIIAESAEGGAIQPSERELIQNVFDFDDRTVRQILKPRNQIVGVGLNQSVEEAARLAVEEGYSRFPVYEENIDQIVGFVHTKDLLRLMVDNEKKSLADIMRPVVYLPSGKKIAQVLRLFQKDRVQLAIVVNEFGGTIGMLTLEDIIEELVGEIQDEYDTEPPIVEKIDERLFRIYAQNPIDEINEKLPVPLPISKTYVTLAGVLMEIADAIPREGQTLRIGNYEVKVLQSNQTSPELVEARLVE